MTQLTNQKISFIGSGNMAEAMLAGLLAKRLVEPAQVVAADVMASQRAHIHHTYGVATTADNSAAIAGADVVILAIKPQALAAVAEPLRGQLAPHALLLSILAGTSLGQLSAAFGHAAVVRAMPNTPAQIGLGMSVWTGTAAVSPTQHSQGQTILSSFGQELFVAEEKYLDMATAINGSGPGYVFLMLEAMVDAGVQLGFGREVANQLVLQTVMGSVQYAIASDKHLAELRNRVTSPGGTTAAGLHALEEAGVRAAFTNAIRAAYERSVELSKK